VPIGWPVSARTSGSSPNETRETGETGETAVSSRYAHGVVPSSSYVIEAIKNPMKQALLDPRFRPRAPAQQFRHGRAVTS